jgi:hypothetical protein
MGKSSWNRGLAALFLLASFFSPLTAHAFRSKPAVAIDLDRTQFGSVGRLYAEGIAPDPRISEPDVRRISVRNPAAFARWLGKTAYGSAGAYLALSDGLGFITGGTGGIGFFPILLVGFVAGNAPGRLPTYSVLEPLSVHPVGTVLPVLRIRNLSEEEAYYLAGLLRYPAAIGDLLSGTGADQSACVPDCGFTRRNGESLDDFVYRMGGLLGLQKLGRASGSILVNDAYYNAASNTLISAGGYAMGTRTWQGCAIGVGLCGVGIAVAQRPPTRKAGLRLTLWDDGDFGWSRRRDIGITGLTFAEACYVMRLFEDLPYYRGALHLDGRPARSKK